VHEKMAQIYMQYAAKKWPIYAKICQKTPKICKNMHSFRFFYMCHRGSHSIFQPLTDVPFICQIYLMRKALYKKKTIQIVSSLLKGMQTCKILPLVITV
jgi:hypothetical protein